MTVRVFNGETGRILEDTSAEVFAQSLLEELCASDHYIEIHVFPERGIMRRVLERMLEATEMSSTFAPMSLHMWDR